MNSPGLPTDMAMAVPCNVFMTVVRAIDNIDFLEQTPSGMNTLHGTAIGMYQQKTASECSSERIFNRELIGHF